MRDRPLLDVCVCVSALRRIQQGQLKPVMRRGPGAWEVAGRNKNEQSLKPPPLDNLSFVEQFQSSMQSTLCSQCISSGSSGAASRTCAIQLRSSFPLCLCSSGNAWAGGLRLGVLSSVFHSRYSMCATKSSRAGLFAAIRTHDGVGFGRRSSNSVCVRGSGCLLNVFAVPRLLGRRCSTRRAAPWRTSCERTPPASSGTSLPEGPCPAARSCR